MPQRQSKPGFFRRHVRLWQALPAALAAMLWTSMMIYFLIWFTSRPASSDGSWPRIGGSYAVFPFISSIGAVLQRPFQGVCIAMAVLLCIAYWIDFVAGRHARVAVGLRLAKMVLTCISTPFLVALSFINVERHHKEHLISAGMQMLFVGAAKVCDWYLISALLRRTPGNPYLRRSRFWKGIATVVAIPTSILTIAGIFGCFATVTNGRVVFTSACWSLKSFSAPSEWVLCLCWVIAIGTVSYDAYHLDYTIELILSTPEMPKKENGVAIWKRWIKKHSEREEDPGNAKLETAEKTYLDQKAIIEEEEEARCNAGAAELFLSRRQTL